LEGARLYHDGQLDGLRTPIPVFLTRGPDESLDTDLRAFYERLIRAVADSDLRDGDWRLCECAGWADNPSWQQLVAWCWSSGGTHHLVVVNYADAPAQGHVRLPWSELAGRDWDLTDRLSGAQLTRSGDEMTADGLYVALDPWSAHFFVF
jgi:hypothetical protein